MLLRVHSTRTRKEEYVLWQFFLYRDDFLKLVAKRGLILKTLIFQRTRNRTELPAELTATQRWLPVTRGWYGQWLHWIARTRTTHQRHNDEKQSTHKSLLLSRFQTSLCLCHPVLRLPTHRDLLPFHANGRHTSVIHDQSLF